MPRIDKLALERRFVAMPIHTKVLTHTDYDLEQAKALLEQVSRKLLAKEWFKDHWLVSVHYFPPEPANPESVTMHVYKSNWYNESRQGIHFETYLGPDEFAKKTIPVMLHIFHTATVPGTNLKRIKVSKPFVDDAFDTIAGWKGYVFRVGKYGTQPFTCKLKFALDTLVDQLEVELCRLCQELGPRMDKILQDVVPAAK